MYEQDNSFEQPSDENIKIWRYMDLSKFISILQNNSLFFSRADKLGDPFEGSYTSKSKENRDFVLRYYQKNKMISENVNSKTFRDIRKFVNINCWHMNNYESLAMWNMYLKSNEGIAIQSTYKKLKEAVNKAEYIIHLGKVKYINYSKDHQEGSIGDLTPFINKRNSFDYEQEIRAIYYTKNNGVNTDSSLEGSHYEYGLSIPINIDILIEKIHLAPKTPDWFHRMVESIVNKYGKKMEIIKSDLDKEPLY